MKRNGSNQTQTMSLGGPPAAPDPAFDISHRHRLVEQRVAQERGHGADGHRVHGRLRVEKVRRRLVHELEAAEARRARAEDTLVELTAGFGSGLSPYTRLLVYVGTALGVGIGVGLHHEGAAGGRWLGMGALLGLVLVVVVDQLVRVRRVPSPSRSPARHRVMPWVSVACATLVAGFMGSFSGLAAAGRTIGLAVALGWIIPALVAAAACSLVVRDAEDAERHVIEVREARAEIAEAQREVARVQGHLDRFRTIESGEAVADADQVAEALVASAETSDTPQASGASGATTTAAAPVRRRRGGQA